MSGTANAARVMPAVYMHSALWTAMSNQQWTVLYMKHNMQWMYIKKLIEA